MTFSVPSPSSRPLLDFAGIGKIIRTGDFSPSVLVREFLFLFGASLEKGVAIHAYLIIVHSARKECSWWSHCRVLKKGSLEKGSF